MANYTLTTSPQEVGRNTANTVGARLLAWYSNAGTSNAMVHLKLQAYSSGTTYVGTNKDYQLILDSTNTGTVTNPDQQYPENTWVDVREITQYVNYNTAVNVSGKIWTYVYGDCWVTGNTVTVAAPYVAPTTPTVSATVSGDTATITYGTTSFGTPSTGTVYLYAGTSASPTTQLAYATTTGDQTATDTGLNTNTNYYYRSRAYNGQLWSDYSADAVITTAPAQPTVTLTSQTLTSATMNWSVGADGGALTKTIAYKVGASGEYTTLATESTGAAASGTFTVTGLSPNTSTTIYVRSSTTSGSAESMVVVTTDLPVYASLNGSTKIVDKLYASVNGATKMVDKLYGSVNGVAKRIY